jgi:hypothetical protein
MFLHNYFDGHRSGDTAGLARLSLIAVLTLYLIGFLNRTFPGENAKIRAFCGGEKLKAAAVYRAQINQCVAP